MDRDALHAAQAARWRAVDPLLPPPSVPERPPVSVAGGVAAGWAVRGEVDPTTLGASWSALRHFVLTAHVGGPDPAEALGELLDRWDGGIRVHAVPGDHDAVAEVTWPSRDTEPVLALVRRGFQPAIDVAVRPTGPPRAVAVPGLTIRPLTASDVAIAVELNLELIRYDSRFGTLTERASSGPRLTESLGERADREIPTAWLADRDGRPVGLCIVDPPASAGWIAGMCGSGPVGYLATLFVDPDARGAGVGEALAAHADAALHAAGAAVTLLHHVVANPLSAPFWHRAGYRPLWTKWQRRPAIPG